MSWEKPLICWYQENKRDLPWRRTREAYKVWISEIMLQQTRVEAVIGYYYRFLEAFPTLEDLAAAPVDTVLKYWEGLGYYSRARNLHKAACQMAESGGFPRSYEEIRKLCGIGDYTAGAVWSIAFNQPAAAVDGNVLRVISRLYALDGDIGDPKVRRSVGEIVLRHVPVTDAQDYENGPSAYTQALMELGATVCIPKNPRCKDCPIPSACLAFAQNRTGELPVKKKKEKQKMVSRFIAIAERYNSQTGYREVLMHRRPDKGLLRGLWEYPGVDASSPEEMKAAFAAEMGLDIIPEGRLLETEHVFTHRHWKMQVYQVKLLKGPAESEESFCWASVDRQTELMIPTAFRKIQEFLAEPEQLRLI